MLRKSFVSLVFSSRRIRVLLLDPKREKVVKRGVYDLPAGVVVNYRVQKKEELAAIIKKIWKELKIGEKSVGIIVPEFSTYTKSISLPKLNLKELDEAIRWQSQEFLPSNPEEMVLDWEIVKETISGNLILATAIKKEVLEGFINATSEAGLYPLVVETPSLSLTRLAEGSGEGRLMVYVSDDEAILVLTQGGSILASSVASSNSQNEIIFSAVRMIRHYYNKVEVAKVYVGGARLAKEFIGGLSQTLQRPVEWMFIDIKGLTPEEVQDYLVAISLQMKEPDQPESAYTVNLLPPGWVKHYRDRIREIKIWTLTLISSFVIWACFLCVVIVYMMVTTVVKEIEVSQEEAGETRAEVVFQRVRDINKVSEKAIAIGKGLRSPQGVISQIAGSKNDGIAIYNYDINFEEGVIKLSGKASDRTSLLEFKRAIEEREDFSGINLPITSLVSQVDLNFDMEFEYLPEATSSNKPMKVNI